TIQLPGEARADGIVAYPRATLPLEAQASLDRVRRLLRLEGGAMPAEGGTARGRPGGGPPLGRRGRAVLGPRGAGVAPRDSGHGGAGGPAPAEIGEEAGPSHSLEPELGREAAANPDVLLYCPEVMRSPRLAKAAGARGVRAAVFAGLPRGDGEPRGHLEVLS